MRCSHKLYEKQAAVNETCPICQREVIHWLSAELARAEIPEGAQVGISWLAELLVESAEQYATHQVDCYRPEGIGCTCGYEFWLARTKETLALVGKTVDLGDETAPV